MATEMSIIHDIAETVSQYEEKSLYDEESHHHKYTLEYDEKNQNMFLKLKESYCIDRGVWSNHYATIEWYEVTPSMYADICIIVLRDHLLIQKNRFGIIGTPHMSKVHPQLISPL